MALFDPIQLGRIRPSHRVVMAPLTRYRADDAHSHTDLAVEHYSQRASVPGTLIISEATEIFPAANSFPNSPMIYSPEQIRWWRRITDAVHAKGSFIFCQIWAHGRDIPPWLLESAEPTRKDLFSSSAVPMGPGFETPREMTEAEILTVVDRFAQAARNAMEAGFDGVEVHGANVDEKSVVDMTADAWGGSVEKRARFCLEITKAVVAAIGADRVGVRLSPFSAFQGMGMADPIPQYSYLIRCLKNLKPAYLHLVESRISGNADAERTETIDFALDIWDNVSPVLVAGGFTPDSAKRAVDDKYRGIDIMIVFGRYFISNPDLPYRVRNGIALNPYNRDNFYTAQAAKGYTDYPFSKEFQVERQIQSIRELQTRSIGELHRKGTGELQPLSKKFELELQIQSIRELQSRSIRELQRRGIGEQQPLSKQFEVELQIQSIRELQSRSVRELQRRGIAEIEARSILQAAVG
ncbi:MAG: hypothetical protein LQ343_006226 [Gyalolechia ehrenbergii]|nr:MAG: hypothetical protein LQ343_006226 [Gyalolechia ehrenbergii]